MPLAKQIVGVKDASIEIPNYFTTAVERVLWVRSSFLKKLAAVGHRLDEGSDARHSFVTVLENVHEALKPLQEASVFDFTTFKNGIPKGHMKNDRAQATPLQNLFEVLDVYEPSSTFVRPPDVAPPKQEELECTAEIPEDSSLEALLAMITLIGDLSRMRAEIAEVWSKYSAGKVDLAAVSVATSTAIELAHTLQAEIHPLIDSQGGNILFHEAYFAGLCHAVGIDRLAKMAYNNDYNFDVYDIADALFLNVRNAIFVFTANNELGEHTVYYGKWGWFDENSGATPTSNRKKYARNKATLQELQQDLSVIYRRPEPIEDQLQRGLTAMQKAQKLGTGPPNDVLLWFAFGAQVYLDTLYSVEDRLPHST